MTDALNEQLSALLDFLFRAPDNEGVTILSGTTKNTDKATNEQSS
jgi:hypothetical protein